MPATLEGKVALVTGGASGIGRAIVDRFHAEGAAVAIVDLDGTAAAVADSLGERAVAIDADVSVAADVSRMVEATVKEFGALHVMCNNAGVSLQPGMIVDLDEENFDRTWEINLKSVFLGIKYGFPAIAASGGGAVVNTSSIAATKTGPGSSAYCVSKAGVAMLTRVAAAEGAPLGIRVNAVAPGTIDTPLHHRSLARRPEMIDAVKAMTPLGRVGLAEEIAATALFLASDESSYTTGQSLVVDGGLMAQ